MLPTWRMLRRSFPPLLLGTALLSLLIGLMVGWHGTAHAQPAFEYLSPRPDAQLVSAHTTVAVRHGEPIETASLNNDRFRVEGSQSGLHTGTVILAGDARTVIFEPDQPFVPAEVVTVTVEAGIRTAAGTALDGITYRFTVSPKPLADYARQTPRMMGVEAVGIEADPSLRQDGIVQPPAGYLTLPADYPHVTITVPATNTGDGYLFLSNFSQRPPSPYLLILDDSGDPVYYRPMQPGRRNHEFKAIPGNRLVYHDHDANRFQVLDQHYQAAGVYQAGNGYIVDYHGMQVREDGHALLQIYDEQPVDMSQVVTGGQVTATVIGAVVQELDPAGNVIFQWRSWDHFAITDASDAIDLTTETVDATHINSVAWDNDGNVLISNRHLDEITKIDRRTADVIWRFGGKQNQFTITNDDRPFSHQHDARRLSSGNLTLYDNGNTNTPPYSRALEYQLDEENLTATKVWEYRHQPEDVYGLATGNAQRLANGNTLIAWGGVGIGGPRPIFTEVMTDGASALEMFFTSGESSYRVLRSAWEGQPFWPPTLVATGEGAQTRLHYSWNGATDVESYRIYGGTTPATPDLLDTQPKQGFETTSTLPSAAHPCYFYRVMPLDGNGYETIFSVPVFTGAGGCDFVVEMTPAAPVEAQLPTALDRPLFSTTLRAPAGAVSDAVSLLYSDAVSPAYAAPAGWVHTGVRFTLGAYEPGRLLSDFSFQQPVSLTLNYTDEAVRGLDETSLTPYAWHRQDQVWRTDGIAVVERDTDRNRLRIAVSHLTRFALFAHVGDRPLAATNLVQDGGFEAGAEDSAWQQTSTNLPTVICDATCSYDNIPQSHTGQHWVFFGGGTAQKEEAAVQQKITAPAGSIVTATLTFWLRIAESSHTGTDVFTVSLDGKQIFSARDSDADTYANYTKLSFDVTPYLNGSHDLRFAAAVEAGHITAFYLDDVALTVHGIFASEPAPLYLPLIARGAQANATHSQGSPAPARRYVTTPDDLPRVRVTTVVTDEVGEGYIFVSPYTRRNFDARPYLLILDNTGDLVYYNRLPFHASDFKVQPTGHLSYFTFTGRQHHVMDAAYTVVETIKAANGHKADIHDFQMLPNGHVLLLAYEERHVDMSQIVEGGHPNALVFGCLIQELDTERNVVFEWSSFDHYAYTDSYDDLTASVLDPIHCNAVEVDTDNHLLLSSRDMDEVTKIDRETGEIRWRLGGKNNQFQFINAIGAENVAFVRQHDVRRVPNGNVTLFDNRTAGYSRAVEYALDETNKTATLVWEYRNTPDIFTHGMANTQRLPNGNTVIGWGHGRPSVTEVKPDGTKVFEMALPDDMQSYRAFRFPWNGRPDTAPALDVVTGTSTVTLTYSWNGATGVAAYEVYGDPSDYPTTLLKTEPKQGFETTTVFTDLVDAASMNFRVVPLDAAGEPMRTDPAPTYRIHLPWTNRGVDDKVTR